MRLYFDDKNITRADETYQYNGIFIDNTEDESISVLVFIFPIMIAKLSLLGTITFYAFIHGVNIKVF